jgi:hypothetical protein
VVAPYLEVIRQYSDARVVYRAHNIEYQLPELNVTAERPILRKICLRLLERQLYGFGLLNMNKPDAVLTINSFD